MSEEVLEPMRPIEVPSFPPGWPIAAVFDQMLHEANMFNRPVVTTYEGMEFIVKPGEDKHDLRASYDNAKARGWQSLHHQ